MNSLGIGFLFLTQFPSDYDDFVMLCFYPPLWPSPPEAPRAFALLEVTQPEPSALGGWRL